MATISDVARLAGVSSATVSHVLNKTRKVNPETSDKVKHAILELDYHPNTHARGLKTGLSRLIGVLNICSKDLFFSEILSHIERAAFAADYGVMLQHSEDDIKAQREAICSMIEKDVDGIIINSPILSDDFYPLIEKLDCPCVFLQFYDPVLKADSIHSDDQTAAYEATRYLIQLQHRQVACIAGCAYEQNSAYQRRAGYEKALLEAGLPIRQELFVCSDYTLQEGYDLFQKLISRPEAPTAFITYSDLLALGALRAAADMGLCVPTDVSIIGFDDIELAAFSVPRLTTIWQDKAQIGKLALRQILKRLQNPQLPWERMILPTRLVLRQSCGPAPAPSNTIGAFGLFH